MELFAIMISWMASVCAYMMHLSDPLAEQDLKSVFFPSVPEQHHASVNSHGKRQDEEIVTRRSVRATYTCPIGGQQTRDFRWEARYDRTTGIVQLNGLEHIQSFDHVLVATNNFKTQFLSRFPQLHDNFCCVYSFKGTIIGTVYPDYIGMGLTPAAVNPRRGLKVTEFCSTLR